MDERVLVPRPDTEVLVEKVLDVVRRDPRLQRVHDVGTGSGCIGIAIKRTLPRLAVSASDISEPALEVAGRNAQQLLGGALPSFRSDMLEAVPGTFDIIASNPPYVRDEEVFDMLKLGWPEPALALRGGEDGTDLAARLIRSAPTRLDPGGWLILEASPPQFTRLYALMDQAGFHSIDVEKDLAGQGPGDRGEARQARCRSRCASAPRGAARGGPAWLIRSASKSRQPPSAVKFPRP